MNCKQQLTEFIPM
uniref:Uncharacterized protein n=1 Tax=Anguilla anguilla TaxID=7936 RepID=A0A0E9UXI1_ANGAN